MAERDDRILWVGDDPERQEVTRHNYAEVIARLQGLHPGVVYQAHVYHDEWCAVFSGGYCNCEPEVTVERAEASAPAGQQDTPIT